MEKRNDIKLVITDPDEMYGIFTLTGDLYERQMYADISPSIKCGDFEISKVRLSNRHVGVSLLDVDHGHVSVAIYGLYEDENGEPREEHFIGSIEKIKKS